MAGDSVLASQHADAAGHSFPEAGSGGDPPILHPRTLARAVTDKAVVYPPVLEEIALGAWHHIEHSANDWIESDHGRLKFRVRPSAVSKISSAHKWSVLGTLSSRTFAADIRSAGAGIQ